MTQYSAIAKHCWEKDHLMNWEGAHFVYKNKQVGQRRVVEGALINVGNSLEGNKSFTQEDIQTDLLVCKSLKIDINKYSKSPDTASSLPSQVAEVMEITDVTGTEAAETRGQQSNNYQLPTLNSGSQDLRRSQRIASQQNSAVI